MSDGVKFVFKTLFKVPIFILAAYLLMNVLGIVTTYFKVQGIQYGLENIVTENNYISTQDLTKLMPQLWALGYSHNPATGTWTKIAYVEEVGFLVVDESGTEHRVQLPNPQTTSASVAATQIKNGIDGCFTTLDHSPTNRTQYGTSKVIGFYADYAVLWPLTVYDNAAGGSFTGGNNNVVTGFDGGNWQNTAAAAPAGVEGSIFTGGNIPVTGDFGEDSKAHANVVRVPIELSNTVVGIKYYSDLY